LLRSWGLIDGLGHLGQHHVGRLASGSLARCSRPKDAVSSNKLLSRLSRADLRLVEPHLEAVDLPLRMQLEARAKRVEQVYFLESGLASVVANGEHAIEVGMIGREGMTGLSVVLVGDSNNRAVYETFMQIGGNGQRMRAAGLREAIEASVSLHSVLLRYAHAFLTQTTQTALANARSKVEERLARWLLVSADLTDSNEIQLTHEFLATMLGVRRAGVTVALQALERTGLVSHRRGVITILDREALERSSNGAYMPFSDH
jgi:CRP-like cAMP-binding protein